MDLVVEKKTSKLSAQDRTAADTTPVAVTFSSSVTKRQYFEKVLYYIFYEIIRTRENWKKLNSMKGSVKL